MSQSVGIGDAADFTPDNTALLELKSIIRGFLMPRMTAAQRIAISTPSPATTPHGLMVIQTDEPNAGLWYYYNDGSTYEWRNIIYTNPAVSFGDITTGSNTTATMTVGTGAEINLSGTGIVEASKFLGDGSTSDAVDLNSNEVAGTLSADKGGTGLSSLPNSGSFIYSNGTSFATTPQPTIDGQILVYDLNTSTWILQELIIPTLPTIEDGKLWIGDVNDEPVAQTITGDGTISNAGLLTVTGIHGIGVSSDDPVDGQILVFNSSSGYWEPSTPAVGGSSKWILNGSKLYPDPLNDWYSLQWGNGNSIGSQSTAFGGGEASGYRATAWGTGTTATQNLATAWGSSADATANLATAWGENTTANSNLATAWGSSTIASGNMATAWGNTNTASAQFATAFGQNTVASAGFTTAWGDNTDATSQYATAFGQNSLASGQYSTAFGLNSIASGTYSTALGQNDTASGTHSLSFGEANKASGTHSTAFGKSTNALGVYSTSSGFNTTAYSGMETVIGQYNTTYSPENAWGWNSPDRVFVIGNGTANNSRSDALRVFKNGNTDIYGNLSLISPIGAAKELRLYEPPALGTNYTGFKADTLNESIVYNLPKADGDSTDILVTDGQGNLSWQPLDAAQFKETLDLYIKIIRKPLDETVTSNVLQDDDHLLVNLDSNERWAIDGVFIANSTANGNNDFSFLFYAPSTMSMTLSYYINTQTTNFRADIFNEGETTPHTYPINNSANVIVFYKGFIESNSSNGTFKLRWSTTASNATVTTDSFLKVTKVTD